MIELLLRSVPLAIVASAPLLFAVEGELLVERSGIINLGVEGMMLSAAMSAVVVAQLTGSAVAGVAGGIAGAMLLAALFGLLVIRLEADQIVTGTAINLMAIGITGFTYRETQRNATFVTAVPQLPSAPLTIAAWLIVPAVLGVVLWRTRFGLVLRATGENPPAVRSAGASVPLHRWAALAAQSILVGAGGADLALALSSGFAENMTAGRGFIALSIVIFGRWKVRGAVAGTALFGAAAALQFALQAANHGVPFHLLLALPYLATLLILCGIAGRVRAPEALGKAR